MPHITELKLTGRLETRARDVRFDLKERTFRKRTAAFTSADANRRGVSTSYQMPDLNRYPRPTNGIFDAITVMNSTLASSGSEAM